MKEVFAAHPGAKTIWVVKGMPFLNETEAKNYALSEKADIEEVERPVDEEETEFEKVGRTIDLNLNPQINAAIAAKLASAKDKAKAKKQDDAPEVLPASTPPAATYTE